MFNKLPDRAELTAFTRLLSDYRSSLPTHFVRDIIMKAPAGYDEHTCQKCPDLIFLSDMLADDTSIPNVLRQCPELISLFPLLSIYGYQAYNHYHNGDSLYVYISPCPIFPQQKISCIFFVLTVPIPLWKRNFWILPL